jgi:hypothetical protein
VAFFWVATVATPSHSRAIQPPLQHRASGCQALAVFIAMMFNFCACWPIPLAHLLSVSAPAAGAHQV